MSVLEAQAISNTNDVKSMEWLKTNVPSIFAKTGAPNTSEKYVHIPTTKVINDLMSLGWEVVNAKEVKARKRVGFQKHLVVLRNSELKIEGKNGDTVFPQLLLTNSNDASNSFKFTAGLFRVICSNGLVVADENFGSLKIRHMGYSFEEVQKVVNQILEMIPLTVESMNKMKNVELNQEKMVELATRALSTRFTEDQLKRFEFDVMDLLNVNRDKDKGNDLWTVFNRVQENLTKGNFRYIDPLAKKRKDKKARVIKNFNQDMEVNQKLFSLALDYVS